LSHILTGIEPWTIASAHHLYFSVVQKLVSGQALSLNKLYNYKCPTLNITTLNNVTQNEWYCAQPNSMFKGLTLLVLRNELNLTCAWQQSPIMGSGSVHNTECKRTSTLGESHKDMLIYSSDLNPHLHIQVRHIYILVRHSPKTTARWSQNVDDC